MKKKFVFLIFFLFSCTLNAGSGAWRNIAETGNWETDSNWAIVQGSGVPGNIDDVAAFIGNRQDLRVILNSNRTIGSLIIENSSQDIEFEESAFSSHTLTFQKSNNTPALISFSPFNKDVRRGYGILLNKIQLESNLNIIGQGIDILTMQAQIVGNKDVTFTKGDPYNPGKPSEKPSLYLFKNNVIRSTNVNGGILNLEVDEMLSGPILSGNLSLNQKAEAIVKLESQFSNPNVIFSDHSLISIFDSELKISSSVSNLDIRLNKITLGDHGSISEITGDAGITFLNLPDVPPQHPPQPPLLIDSGTISLSRLNISGTIQNKAAKTNSTCGQAIIQNGLRPTVQFNLNNHPLTFEIEARNLNFDTKVTNGEFITGNIIKEGLGTLLFNGRSGILRVPLAINNGLVLMGDNSTDIIAQVGETDINPNGALGGLGTFAPSSAIIVNGGSIKPGTPSQIGTLNVNRDILFNNGSLQIRALTPTKFDQLKVNVGAVTLHEPTLIFDAPFLTRDNIGNRFDIIDNTVGLGIKGSFLNVVFKLPSELTGTIEYRGNLVTVVIEEAHRVCPPCPDNDCGEILPPSDLRACVKENNSHSKVRLSWDSSPCESILGYFIYRNGKYIATVEKDEGNSYEDSINDHKCYLYQVTAIQESDPISIKINKKK